jgi:cytochrome c-type biogenesis protein CcmH/NrfF
METISQLAFALLSLLWLVPLVALVWAVLLLARIARNQQMMIRLLASIESELRAAGDARRWPVRPE